MKVLIIEDEIVAAKRLENQITKNDPEIEVVEVLDSVIDATNYLAKNSPDLIFLDIQLSDGMCFEIFEKVELSIPIIFTTAYDEYMQQAFKVNSIDYLLKPIRQNDLDRSIKKFKNLNHPKLNPKLFNRLFEEFVKENKAYKCRFIVKSGRSFVSVDARDIAYIIAENKLNYVVVNSGKRYLVDSTLEQLEKVLNPDRFLKINRNYIISYTCVEHFESYFNNRILIEIKPSAKEDVLVSRSYLKAFRVWMDT